MPFVEVSKFVIWRVITGGSWSSAKNSFIVFMLFHYKLFLIICCFQHRFMKLKKIKTEKFDSEPQLFGIKNSLQAVFVVDDVADATFN